MIRASLALRKLNRRETNTRRKPAVDPYESFTQLNGTHPLQREVPQSCVLYRVRKLNRGKVGYFNFALAKEMGLIPKNHAHELTVELEKRILDAFAIRIINKFDLQNGLKVSPKDLKPHPYMATRYLQLQHSDKSGRTSGDGRSIWNGQVVHQGVAWDVSSRGTGVTCLAPGAVEAGKPLRTGQGDFGYGCGLADNDELYGTAIMSEIFHRHGIHTERVLAVIDLGNGVGIGVRAGKNLLRPAHLFSYLKQGDHANLKRSLDYFLRREKLGVDYSKFLTGLTRDFARFVGRLDADYIFAWMDWDGDNLLLPPGIIDYGSIRQFGLRHEAYRYDDVDRFSSNLKEQRVRARRIVQTFIQLTHFAQTGTKKSWSHFKSHPLLSEFDSLFEESRVDRLLYHVGFSEAERKRLTKWQSQKVQKFVREFRFFETAKTLRKMSRVADGIHRPAIYNMRKFLQLMPNLVKRQGGLLDFAPVGARQFFSKILSRSATGRDRFLRSSHVGRMSQLQLAYVDLLKSMVNTQAEWDQLLDRLANRAQIINRPDRITGNAVATMADRLATAVRRGLSVDLAQRIIEDLIRSQDLIPEYRPVPQEHLLESHGPESRKLLKSLFRVAHSLSEDI